MGPVNDLLLALRGTLTEWLQIRWSDLQFVERPTALMLAAALLAIPVAVLLLRVWRSPNAVRRLALPALLPIMVGSRLSAFRHSAFVLFALGVPFFALAIADPRAAVVREGTTQSGRRIALVIDGSGSMVLPFEAPRLQPAMDRAFYTAVAAAQRFVRLRMAEHHNDIVGVVEFGNEAFVVTPFTTDYNNAILSLALIGDPRAWNRFNVFGTTIIQGIAQALELFRTFDVIDVAGNMMVIFTDGNDGETTFRGRTLDQLMDEARMRHISIYMVRVGFKKPLGEIPYDPLWKRAVERSGGRFYAASDEGSLLRAVTDIDRVSTGRIAVTRYSTAAPAFPGYAMVAVALWLTAGTLKLAFPFFTTFP
jgi:Mg-chelatase subunit ChlD